MSWKYRGKEYTELPEEYFGFVYIITHRETGKSYIGKKQFKSLNTRRPLKGKKRKRRIIKESNWKNYWGSSEYLKEFIQEEGLEKFDREILILCTSKSSLTYNETRLLFENNVL